MPGLRVGHVEAAMLVPSAQSQRAGLGPFNRHKSKRTVAYPELKGIKERSLAWESRVDRGHLERCKYYFKIRATRAAGRADSWHLNIKMIFTMESPFHEVKSVLP